MKLPLTRLNNTIIPHILNAALIGFLCAFIVYGFNVLADWCVDTSAHIYHLVRENPAFIPLVVLGVAALALFAGYTAKLIPQIRGGGIPFTEGVVRGKLTFKWFLAMPAMLIATCISILMGLSVGSEGPSIYLGSSTGYGVSNIFRYRHQERRLYATAGACSGLAVAFNTPLVGIIFSVEEAHRRFSPQIIIPAMVAVVTGVLTRRFLFETPLFFQDIKGLIDGTPTAAHIIAALIIGTIVGIFAVLFNFMILKPVKFLDRIPQQFKILIPAALAIIAGLFIPYANGSGKAVFIDMAEIAFWSLVLILVVKLFLLVLSSRSGASGGIFVPMMTLGAIIGALISNIMSLMGIEHSIVYLVLMGAGCMFAASVRAPLTAIVLAFEVTVMDMDGLIGITAAVMIAYSVAELTKSKPLYEAMLERILERENIHKTEPMREFSLIVSKGSFAVGRIIRDLVLPDNTVIIKITRKTITFVPDGETEIEVGDAIIVACEAHNIVHNEKELNMLFSG